MNTVVGSVIVSETGRGIPNLLVVAFDVNSTTGSTTLPQDAWLRLASTITDAEGRFRIEYETSTAAGDARARVQLLLTVSPPEETADAREPLFVAPTVRKNASASEAYYVRIPAADLEKNGIALPGEADEGIVEPPERMRQRLTARARRDLEVASVAQEAVTVRVAQARGELTAFRDEIRPALADRLSSVRPQQRGSETFVAADASVQATHGVVVDRDLKEVISPKGRRPRAVTRFALTEAQAGAVRDKLDSDLNISAADLRMALGAEQAPQAGPTYLRTDPADVVRRAPSPRETEALAALAGASPPVPALEPEDRLGNGIEPIASSDVPRFIARLVDTMTSPEEAVLAGLEPRATQGTVRQTIEELAFKPSPADTPAFYDFHNLQVAFRHVWQEAIDQGVLDIAESAYNEIVLAGGQPPRDGIIVDPVRGLRREAAALQLAARRATVSPKIATRSVPPPGGSARASQSLLASFGILDGLLTTHLSDLQPLTPIERLPDLLDELEQRMQEPYAFTTFAANRRERSVNFGVLVTYRQRWVPTMYQAGRLAKTITLAPKEVQRYTRTVKRQHKRAEREVQNHLRVRKDEMSTTARAEEEIVRKANTKTNFNLSSESSSGTDATGKAMTKTAFDREVGQTSEAVKRNFRESVVKAAQEFKDEVTVEVNSEDIENLETSDSGEISNPNDELAVTFLFYELQRRYAVSESLHRLSEVVLVAQEMPAPHEINEAWLVSHDWILRRTILDDSFLPALDYLSQHVVGDRVALAEMRTNIQQQRNLIAELQRELGVVRSRLATYRNLLERSLLQRSAKKKGHSGGLFSGIPVVGNAVDLVEDAIDAVGDFIHPDMPEVGDSRQDTLKDAMQRTADEERDLLMRVEREVTALNALTESYAKALAKNYNQRTQILRLRTHIKQNILYYMQAVWNHEPPDQRYLRLHEVSVPTFAHQGKYHFANGVVPAHAAMTAYAHRTIPGRDLDLPTKVFEAEIVPSFKRLKTRPLAQVADLDNLLGYFGNYMIFALKESNSLTRFMAEPYVLRGFEELIDPDDVGNWTLEEFADYVLKLKDRLSEPEFEHIRQQLKDQYEKLLKAPHRNGEEIIVPTGSLFIEALPATTSLLERFKTIHRAVDVKKVQAETRRAELENLRLIDRLLHGEREDPETDKKIVVEHASNITVPLDEL
ncbi:hypothetical protein [Deinococcus aerophilus]|uniref:Uncharacterized protein n=1 Tax=Deinococcus aerophilus TaxID=522488 RepID=A0ABQ2GW36_9DEIO|nr:hypothetical protein [Deinococcus aerophilus]GGM16240.1 hypothetical protein GCM10010841_25730 [Deinococcus aerophilus]